MVVIKEVTKFLLYFSSGSEVVIASLPHGWIKNFKILSQR